MPAKPNNVMFGGYYYVAFAQGGVQNISATTRLDHAIHPLEVRHSPPPRLCENHHRFGLLCLVTGAINPDLVCRFAFRPNSFRQNPGRLTLAIGLCFEKLETSLQACPLRHANR